MEEKLPVEIAPSRTNSNRFRPLNRSSPAQEYISPFIPGRSWPTATSSRRRSEDDKRRDAGRFANAMVSSQGRLLFVDAYSGLLGSYRVRSTVCVQTYFGSLLTVSMTFCRSCNSNSLGSSCPCALAIAAMRSSKPTQNFGKVITRAGRGRSACGRFASFASLQAQPSSLAILHLRL